MKKGEADLLGDARILNPIFPKSILDPALPTSACREKTVYVDVFHDSAAITKHNVTAVAILGSRFSDRHIMPLESLEERRNYKSQQENGKFGECGLLYGSFR